MPALTPFIEQFKNKDGSTYNGAAMLANLTGLSQAEVEWTAKRIQHLTSVERCSKEQAMAVVKAERVNKPWIKSQSGNSTAAFLAIVAFSVISACAYITGYTHGKSKCTTERAQAQTRTETITQVVTVTDKAAVNTLQARLKAYQSATSTLQARIEEARHEAADQSAQPHPAGAPSCALADSLRDDINATLASPR